MSDTAEGSRGDGRLKELLVAAIERTASERSAFVSEVRDEDAKLGARLAELVSAWDSATTMLRDPAGSPLGVVGAGSAVPAEGEGDRVGAFLLGKTLGEGGFGIVHRAAQESPVKREVALKILKPGMDSRAFLRRFEAERQALARLEHPSIARIYDAGATATGRPYFAMELVEGEPITTFCELRELAVEERVRLMEAVCLAVQHAHQKGIIHRDIKPSNILVAESNGRSLPKVIDFGIAKAMDEPLTDHSVMTVGRQVVGTPRYMSPEQAEMGASEVDTRSDVYSLGVVLYELLCGTTPLTDKTLRGAGVGGLAKAIRDARVARPSARAAESGRASFARELAGDLDWITMRAIDPDPSRRYATANALWADLERSLHDQPVEARPPSRAYISRKFVRRHRVAVSAAGAVVVALVLGLVFALAGFREARIEGEAARLSSEAAKEASEAAIASSEAANAALVESNTVAEFLSEMIRSVDAADRGRDVTVAELLDDALEDLETGFDGRDEVRAHLLHQIGQAYYALGQWPNCERAYTLALDLYRGSIGPDDPKTLSTEGNLVSLIYEKGETARALDLSRSLVDRVEAALGDMDQQTIGVWSNHALMLGAAGQVDEALAAQRRVLELTRLVLGEEHERTVGALHNLAQTLAAIGRGRAEPALVDEAETLYREAIALAERALTEDHPAALLARTSIGAFYHRGQRHAEAEPFMREGLERRREVLGPMHTDTLLSTYNFGANQVALGNLGVAEGLFITVIEAVPGVLPPSHPMVWAALSNLSIVHTPTDWGGMSDETAALVVRVMRDAEETGLLSIQYRNQFAMIFGTIRPESHRDPEHAESLARGVCAEAESAGDPFLFGYLDTLAIVLSEAGKHDEAIATQELAIALVPEDQSPVIAELQATKSRIRDAAGIPGPTGDATDPVPDPAEDPGAP